MPAPTKQQFIWAQIKSENPTCEAAALAYIAHAKLASLELGTSQLCVDGFPHAGKRGQSHPKWDKIKAFIAGAREKYSLAYPNCYQIKARQSKGLFNGY